jgi:hypothetical protein
MGAMLAVLACARAAPSANVASIAGIEGCYALRPGPWEQDPILTRTISASWIPRTLRLTRERLTGWDMLQSDSFPMFVVRTGPDSVASTGMFSYWVALRGARDSVFIGAPLPMAGASLKVAPAPNGLAGTITVFTDAIPPDGIAEVTLPAALDRIACR